MEKISVAIQRKEGYVVSVVAFVGAALAFVLNMVLPSAQRDERILGYVIAAIAVVIGVAFLFVARRSDTLDESGITIRCSTKEKRYDWSEIGKVSVVPLQGKDLLKLRF